MRNTALKFTIQGQGSPLSTTQYIKTQQPTSLDHPTQRSVKQGTHVSNCTTGSEEGAWHKNRAQQKSNAEPPQQPTAAGGKQKNYSSHCNSPCGILGLWEAFRRGTDPRCRWSFASPLSGWFSESADETVCVRLVAGSTPHFHPYSPPGNDTEWGRQRKGGVTAFIFIHTLPHAPAPSKRKHIHSSQKPHPPTRFHSSTSSLPLATLIA